MTSRTLPPRRYEAGRTDAREPAAQRQRHSLTALVCGSRHGEAFLDGQVFGLATRALTQFDELTQIGHVITGSRRGFDGNAVSWAEANERPYTVWAARWKELKRQAGPVRNTEQLKFLLRITDAASRVVLAFPGEDGTADMIDKARAASVPVYRCIVEGRHWHWMPP